MELLLLWAEDLVINFHLSAGADDLTESLWVRANSEQQPAHFDLGCLQGHVSKGSAAGIVQLDLDMNEYPNRMSELLPSVRTPFRCNVMLLAGDYGAFDLRDATQRQDYGAVRHCTCLEEGHGICLLICSHKTGRFLTIQCPSKFVPDAWPPRRPDQSPRWYRSGSTLS